MAWDSAIINLDEAMSRVLGRKELYKGWLDTFFKDESFNAVAQAFESKDYTAAYNALHKLKGTAGNLSVAKVFDIATKLDVRIKAEDDFDSLAEGLETLKDSFYSAKSMFEENIDVLMSYGELAL